MAVKINTVVSPAIQSTGDLPGPVVPAPTPEPQVTPTTQQPTPAEQPTTTEVSATTPDYETSIQVSEPAKTVTTPTVEQPTTVVVAPKTPVVASIRKTPLVMQGPPSLVISRKDTQMTPEQVERETIAKASVVESYNKNVEALNIEARKITEEVKKLEDEKKSLNLEDPNAVSSFNKRVDELNAKSSSLQSRSAELQKVSGIEQASQRLATLGSISTGQIAQQHEQLTALKSLDKYTTDGQNYNIPQAIRDGVSTSTIETAFGLQGKDVVATAKKFIADNPLTTELKTPIAMNKYIDRYFKEQGWVGGSVPGKTITFAEPTKQKQLIQEYEQHLNEARQKYTSQFGKDVYWKEVAATAPSKVLVLGGALTPAAPILAIMTPITKGVLGVEGWKNVSVPEYVIGAIGAIQIVAQTASHAVTALRNAGVNKISVDREGNVYVSDATIKGFNGKIVNFTTGTQTAIGRPTISTGTLPAEITQNTATFNRFLNARMTNPTLTAQEFLDGEKLAAEVLKQMARPPTAPLSDVFSGLSPTFSVPFSLVTSGVTGKSHVSIAPIDITTLSTLEPFKVATTKLADALIAKGLDPTPLIETLSPVPVRSPNEPAKPGVKTKTTTIEEEMEKLMEDIRKHAVEVRKAQERQQKWEEVERGLKKSALQEQIEHLEGLERDAASAGDYERAAKIRDYIRALLIQMSELEEELKQYWQEAKKAQEQLDKEFSDWREANASKAPMKEYWEQEIEDEEQQARAEAARQRLLGTKQAAEIDKQITLAPGTQGVYTPVPEITWERGKVGVRVIPDANLSTGYAEITELTLEQLEEQLRKAEDSGNQELVRQLRKEIDVKKQQLEIDAKQKQLEIETTKTLISGLTKESTKTDIITQTHLKNLLKALTQTQLQTLKKLATQTSLLTQTQLKLLTLTQLDTLVKTLTQTQVQTLTKLLTDTTTTTTTKTSNKIRFGGRISLPKMKDGESKKKKIPNGSIAWRQGAPWGRDQIKYIPPPYTSLKPISLFNKTPVGWVDKGRTPEETLQVIGSRDKVPKSISIDLGVVDIFITDYARKIEFTGKGLVTDVGTRIIDNTKGMALEDARMRAELYPKKVKQITEKTAQQQLSEIL